MNIPSRRPRGTAHRLVHVMTVPESLVFFGGQVTAMARAGWDVHVVASPGEGLDDFASRHPVTAHAVGMGRQISPVRDLRAVWQLVRLLRSLRPEVVDAHTPKAGLLGMVSAWVCRVPLRIYHVHGLPAETSHGWRRTLLLASDRVACRLAHRVLCVSPSLRSRVLELGLATPDAVQVLGPGSINGVDSADQYDPARVRDEALRLRERIGASGAVIGYVGRLAGDKGAGELPRILDEVQRTFPSTQLLVVGQPDLADPLADEELALLRDRADITMLGHQGDPSTAMAACDVLVLPTRREGFGLVALEAAALEVPTVGYRVTGLVDAVVDGQTGRLCDVGNVQEVGRQVAAYLGDPALRRADGARARRRAVADFRPQDLWDRQQEIYEQSSGR